MVSNILSLTLDVLKPHQPSVLELADRLAGLETISHVNITVLEIDANTETIKVYLVGEEIDFDTLRAEIEEAGATIHSIDQVSAGRRGGSEGSARGSDE